MQKPENTPSRRPITVYIEAFDAASLYLFSEVFVYIPWFCFI